MNMPSSIILAIPRSDKALKQIPQFKGSAACVFMPGPDCCVATASGLSP